MDITDFFEFEDVGRSIEALETPTPVIDIDVVDRNLRKWQARCEKAGFANRPHIKTHKLVPLARYQLALGASGITVQKLGEAEVMADAGISDMLLTFNVMGRHKLERLAALARRTAISLVADNEEMLPGLAEAGRAAGRDISVLVECDTGAHRNGVQTPKAAVDLAKKIDGLAGISYGGLMTYPGPRAEAAAFLAEAKALAARTGLETKTISTGGTPDMWKDDGLSGITEYRAGTYIYFDRSNAERHTCSYDDCALTVLSTVVSTPVPERAMLDAGTKALTSDLVGLKGFGVVRDLDFAPIANASEEHGFLDLTQTNRRPHVSDLVRVVPNHVCPVTNLYDKVVFTRGGEVLGAVPVDARGKVQ